MCSARCSFWRSRPASKVSGYFSSLCSYLYLSSPAPSTTPSSVATTRRCTASLMRSGGRLSPWQPLATETRCPSAQQGAWSAPRVPSQGCWRWRYQYLSLPAISIASTRIRLDAVDTLKPRPLWHSHRSRRVAVPGNYSRQCGRCFSMLAVDTKMCLGLLRRLSNLTLEYCSLPSRVLGSSKKSEILNTVKSYSMF